MNILYRFIILGMLFLFPANSYEPEYKKNGSEFGMSDAITIAAVGTALWSTGNILDDLDNSTQIPVMPSYLDVAGVVVGVGVLIWQYWTYAPASGKPKR